MGFEIEVLGHRIKFVDREKEVEALIRFAENGSPVVEFVYGPEGCGKSTLLRYVTYLLSNRSDFVAIYIDVLEQDVSKAVLGVDIPKNEVVELAKAFGGFLGVALALSITKLVEIVYSRLRFSGKNLVLFVDDPVKALGIDRSEAYVKWLYELIYRISKEFNIKKILILATSSEGLSRKRLVRHTYLHISLLWNLPYDGFVHLVEQLPKPMIDPERLWRLTGGNPRMLIDLALRYRWDVDRWLEDLCYRLVEVVKDVSMKKLGELLKQVVEDPDTLWYSSEAQQLAEILEKENLIIYKYSPTLTREELREDPDLGIGKYYAWQIPAYRTAIKRLLRIAGQ